MPKVIVIDSEAKTRDAVSRFLIPKGYQIAAVPHGVDAARVMRQDTPDLVLIDQAVPMGGLKTARLLRLHPKCGRVPILLGVNPAPRNQLQQIIQESTQIGITGALVRPYKPSQLLEKLKAIFSNGNSKKGAQLEPPSTTEIRRQIRELADLPTLSPAHQRIISIMSQDDAEIDVNALVEAIQSDQALTMRIMRIARSAYYGFGGNFIGTAVTFLGMPRLRRIVQSATVLEVFEREGKSEDSGLDLKQAWMHSVACGLVMQVISRDNRQARHFTLGLMHDVGKFVLDYRFHEYSKAIVEIATKEQRPMHAVEQELLGITHMEIGYELANMWQLPNEVAESVVHHHAPYKAYRHKYLSSLVYLADVAVRQMEIGDSGNHETPEVADEYAKKLHVDLGAVALQREDLVEQIRAIVSP